MTLDMRKFDDTPAYRVNAHESGDSCAAATRYGLYPDLPRRAVLRGIIGMGIALAGGAHTQLALASGLKVGEPAPPLVLHTLDGGSIATRDLLGHVVIATFWATWCDPCRDELPLLSAYASQHAGDGVQVLGFSLDGPEDMQKVRAAAESLSFPVGLLGSPWVDVYGRIWRIPVSFVIDRAGRLAYNGWDDDAPVWTKERLRHVVDPLLARAR
jgi:peroxiredoxin